jgi:hypothetical protein
LAVKLLGSAKSFLTSSPRLKGSYWTARFLDGSCFIERPRQYFQGLDTDEQVGMVSLSSGAWILLVHGSNKLSVQLMF